MNNDNANPKNAVAEGLHDVQKIFVLLECWYEGDSYLVDDSFKAVSFNQSSLKSYAKNCYPDKTVEVYENGDEVPDDGHYGDSRKRFRIIEVEIWSEGE